ncbi:MAG TPA: hypothetical protein VKY74_02680 [Chloroflexia bacterium]|nr:hypothetical protein [Chloroflexia bacterium]
MPKPPIAPADRARIALLDAIIRETFYCFLQEPPGDTLEIISAWHAVLAEVPTERLYDLYLAAIREHRGPSLLSAPELLAAWYALGPVLSQPHAERHAGPPAPLPGRPRRSLKRPPDPPAPGG